jgi:hypothetical protein
MNGLLVNYTSARTLTVGAGQCRDITNTYDILLSSDTVLNVNGRLGANGLDTGTIAANSWYGVWAISGSTNSVPTAVILSLASNTVPTMPFEYNAYRLIDFWRTDSSSNFIQMFTSGNNGFITKQYSDLNGISVLTNGTSATPVNLSLANFIPPRNYIDVKLSVNHSPNGGSNKFMTVGIPGGISGFQTASIPGTPVTHTLNVIDLYPGYVAGVPTIFYNVVANTDTANILCLGYRLAM